MAHPNLTGGSSRRLLTTGLAAALIALPLGGAAIAADLSDLELAEQLAELTPEQLELYEEGLIDEFGNPIDDALKTADSVTRVVEKAVREAAPVAIAPSPRPSNGVPGNDAEQEAADGSGMQRVREPGGTAPASTTPARPAPAFDNNGPLQPGMRSQSMNPSMQSFVAPPVVSAPFAFDLPQVAERFIGEAPLTAPSSVATPAFASSSTPMGGMVPGGVPGWMLATAAGMLLFVGGAHALHAYDRRWKAAKVTTTS